MSPANVSIGVVTDHRDVPARVFRIRIEEEHQILEVDLGLAEFALALTGLAMQPVLRLRRRIKKQTL